MTRRNWVTSLAAPLLALFRVKANPAGVDAIRAAQEEIITVHVKAQYQPRTFVITPAMERGWKLYKWRVECPHQGWQYTPGEKGEP